MATTVDEIARPEPLLVATRRTRGALLWLRARPGLLAFVLYALLAELADFPIWPGDPHQVPTQLGGDIVQTAWFLEWTPYALVHGHNPLFSGWINYPNGVDIAQNTGMQLLAILTAPLTFSVNAIASENLLRFFAFTLSAYAAYWVLRHWTRGALPAFVGGLFYGFSPYMVSQGEFHLNLIFVPFPPLIFYALYQLLVAQEERPVRWGVLLGVFSVCQFYISAEVLATTGLIAALGTFYLFFLGFRFIPTHYRYALIGIGTAAAILAPLVAYPVYEMLRGASHYIGPAQGFNNIYNADLLGPLIPTKDQLVAPAHLAQIGSGLVGAQIQENGSYLGIPLLLLTIFLVTRYWRQLWPLFLALMAASAFVLSLGPSLVVDGKHHPLPIELPFHKIEHLPIIENILPVRLSLYSAFFIAVILAIGIDSLITDVRAARASRIASAERSSRRNALICGLLGIVAAIAILPNWPYRTIPVTQGVHYAETPQFLGKVIPAGSKVLAYPYPTSFFDMAMLWQTLDHMNFKLFGSYALVPEADGTASIFPTILQPSRVEAMLVNSVTMIPDPDLPNLVATSRSIVATKVQFLPKAQRISSFHAPIVGRVGSIDHKDDIVYVYPNRYTPVAVQLTPTTKFVDPGSRVPSAAGLAYNKKVAIYGTIGPGTVTPAMVRGLRSYLHQNHVQVVIVGLGIADGTAVVDWFRSVLGHPTRAGGGAEIWTDVASRVR